MSAEAHCKACGNPMTEGRAYESGSHRWHVGCFRCSTCNDQLTAHTNMLVLGDGTLVCANCSYECAVCAKKIKDMAVLTNDQAFCASCFVCRNCKKRIDDSQYARTSKGIFCMVCHTALSARKRQLQQSRKQQLLQAQPTAAASPGLSTPSNPAAAADRLEIGAASAKSSIISSNSSKRDKDSPGSPSEVSSPQSIKTNDSRANDSKISDSKVNESKMNDSKEKMNDSKEKVNEGGTRRLRVPRKQLAPSAFHTSSPEPDARSSRSTSRLASPEAEMEPSPVGALSRPVSAHSQRERETQRETQTQRERDAHRDSHVSQRDSRRDSMQRDQRDQRDHRDSHGSQRDSHGSQRDTHRDSHVSRDSQRDGHRDSLSQHRDSLSQHRDSMSQHRDSLSQRDSQVSHRDSHRDSMQPYKIYDQYQSQKHDVISTPPRSRSRTATSISTPDTHSKSSSTPRVASGTVTPTMLGSPAASLASSATSTSITASSNGAALDAQAATLSPDGIASPRRSQSRPTSPGRLYTERSPNHQLANSPQSMASHQLHQQSKGQPNQQQIQQQTQQQAQQQSQQTQQQSQSSQSSQSQSSQQQSQPQQQPKEPAQAQAKTGASVTSSPTQAVAPQGTPKSPFNRWWHKQSDSISSLKTSGTSYIPITLSHSRSNSENMLDVSPGLSTAPTSPNTAHSGSSSNSSSGSSRPTSSNEALAALSLEQERARLAEHKLRELEQRMRGECAAESGDLRPPNEGGALSQSERTELEQQVEKSREEHKISASRNKQLKEMNAELERQTLEKFGPNSSWGSQNPPFDQSAGTSPANSSKDVGASSGSSMAPPPPPLTAPPGPPVDAPMVTRLDDPQIESSAPSQAQFSPSKSAKQWFFRRPNKSSAAASGSASSVNGSSSIGSPFSNGSAGSGFGSGSSAGQRNFMQGYKPYNHPNGSGSNPALNGGMMGPNGQMMGSNGAMLGPNGGMMGGSNTGGYGGKASILGDNLIQRTEIEKADVPYFVTRCFAEIESRGLDTEGIYRKPGSKSQIDAILAQFGPGGDAKVGEESSGGEIQAVSSAVKQYSRALSEPVIAYDAYETFVAAGNSGNPEVSRRAMHLLPAAHSATSRAIVSHSTSVASHEATNSMNVRNLAMVFAPTIAREESGDREIPDMQARNEATQMSILHPEVVLGPVDELL